MWSPSTGAIVVVGATVVEVVVGAIVVEVVVGATVVVVDVVVDEVAGMTGAADLASCHCESTYETAPPTIRAVKTRSTMPTLRFARPA
jgi:hypothetical protein